MPSSPPRTALVLSAGGVRGAYQVGVLLGIVDVLGLHGAGPGPPLFDIYSGTSIGALNAAFLAAMAHRLDHAITKLVDVWTSLELGEILPPSPLGLWGWPRWRLPGRLDRLLERREPYLGRSFFDPRPLEALIRRCVAWDSLHVNIRRAVVRAFTVAVFDVSDGYTTLFSELAPGVELRPSAYPTRRTIVAPITAERVLASTALPLIFPARHVDGRYYVDGALRFSTPISPAINAGADRVVVISLLHRSPARAPAPERGQEYPSVAVLLGKILGALLLDPVVHDLESLLRSNRAFELLSGILDPGELARVSRRFEEEQVLPYRAVPVLVFRPSEDIGLVTARFIREELDAVDIGWVSRKLIRWLSHSDIGQEADLASILLLDGRLAARLIDLGRRDAHAAAARIVAFFSGP